MAKIEDHVTKPDVVVTAHPGEDKPMGLGGSCGITLTNTTPDAIHVVPAEELSVSLQEPLPDDSAVDGGINTVGRQCQNQRR